MTDISHPRIRQEVFQRPGSELGSPDKTVMGGVYVDRELYSFNTIGRAVPLLPRTAGCLGRQVVDGRSRPVAHLYLCRRVLDATPNALEPRVEARACRAIRSRAARTRNDCRQLIPAVNATLASLPAADRRADLHRRAADLQQELHRVPWRSGLPAVRHYGGPGFLRRRESAATILARSPRLARSLRNMPRPIRRPIRRRATCTSASPRTSEDVPRAASCPAAGRR